MWKWTSTSRSVLVHFHIGESWKVGKLGKYAPAVATPVHRTLPIYSKCKQESRSAQSVQDEASLSPAATKASFSSAPRPQISITHGICSVTLGHDWWRCQRRGNDPATGGEKDCHQTRAAYLLERSRGQVREGRDFSAEISHEEAYLQEASRSS